LLVAIDQMDRYADTQAWKAAYQKARAIGWLSS